MKGHLYCAPLMFTAMFFIEHALEDYLHGKLSLKHIVDWIVLRKKSLDWCTIEMRCKEFSFDRFLKLINALADVVEGEQQLSDLPASYQEAFEEIFQQQVESKGKQSWFQRRIGLFFEIIRNRKKYKNFGYCSMLSFLFNSVFTYFFDQDVKLETE